MDDHRAGDGSAFDRRQFQLPAQVPPHLLHDPAFLTAARERDFTTLFARAHDHGVSYYRISEASGIKPGRISLIARGEGTVTALDTIVRVGDALRIPGAHLRV
ncbi:hypothetical protein [Streptomyces sp. NPDC003015]